MRDVMRIDVDVTIDKQALRKSVLMLRVILLPVSRKIIEALDEEREMHVSGLVEKFESEKIAQPVVSLHLGLLRKYKLVIVRTSGQKHYYKLNYDTITNITNAIKKFMGK
jgi:DNA-binding transcriptional ArsR family regulator